jgi:hypothetical protein
MTTTLGDKGFDTRKNHELDFILPNIVRRDLPFIFFSGEVAATWPSSSLYLFLYIL